MGPNPTLVYVQNSNFATDGFGVIVYTSTYTTYLPAAIVIWFDITVVLVLLCLCFECFLILVLFTLLLL